MIKIDRKSYGVKIFVTTKLQKYIVVTERAIFGACLIKCYIGDDIFVNSVNI